MNKLICPNGTLEICVAKTFFSRFLGLMFMPRDSFCGALLIQKCSSVHTFFMRFCIDVVFLDKSNKVLRVVKNLKPWRVVTPISCASSVLELKSGFADKYIIKEGITLLFEFSDCNEK